VYAFKEPTEIVERVDASRRLHETVAHAVAARFARAGARVSPPQGGFYCYPDLEDLREPLGIGTSAELARILLERYGVGVLPGSAFGEPPESLKIRVATSLLYGETDEQRLQALSSGDPLRLPWIAGALDRISEVLADLSGGAARARTPRVALTA
jgi:aspartate/methionine/tyrosine aminotransferase